MEEGPEGDEAVGIFKALTSIIIKKAEPINAFVVS
jgi:hypothetical protein